MKPFRRAVVHIGTERTGSTSIQQAMYAGRRALFHAGVFVPQSLLRSYEKEACVAKHALFVLALADPEQFPEDLVPIEARSQRPADIQRQVLDAMKSEFEHPDSRTHTLLISAEHMHSRLDTLEAVSRIRSALEPWAEEFQILVILRPQIDMAVSLANLVLRKSGRDVRLIPLFDDPGGYDRVMGVRPTYFELDELLQRYETVFGADAVRPFLYPSGGVFDSPALIFDAIGVPAPARLEGRANASLSHDALQVMRCLHHHIDLVGNPDWRPAFIDDVDRILGREHRGPGLRPARDAAALFMDRFSAGNERIRRRYFPERQSLFDLDFDSYPSQSETLGEIPDWARVMVNVLVETWQR